VLCGAAWDLSARDAIGEGAWLESQTQARR
jgi:hypothetical protein